MCELSNLSLSELNAMTKTQLIAKAVADRRETILELDERDERGQLRQSVKILDGYGNLTGRQEISWTYHDTGEVNEITVTEEDALGKMIGGYIVKHPLGDQPTLTKLKAQEKQL